MGLSRYEIKKLIVELLNKKDELNRNAFIATLKWLNPILDNAVNDEESLAEWFASCWSTAHLTKEDVIKLFDDLYEFYDDSDLFSESSYDY